MLNDKELLQQALDALISVWNMDKTTKQVETIQTIKARLAQPELEPIAWMYEFGTDNADAINEVRWYKNVSLTKPHGMVRNVVPLYTEPQKKEWVGLTQEEIWHLSQFNCGTRGEFARAIEAKLKEKNGMD